MDGDARRQELLACAAPIAAAQLGPVLAGVEHVYLGPLHPRDLAEDVLAAIDGVVSLDIQGYVRRIEGTQVHQGVLVACMPLCNARTTSKPPTMN